MSYQRVVTIAPEADLALELKQLLGSGARIAAVSLTFTPALAGKVTPRFTGYVVVLEVE